MLSFTVAGDEQMPPYVDPNTVPGYGPSQTPFQPPPVIPHASFPKGNCVQR